MSEHPVYDSILARRSIREFLDKPVEHSDIELMLKAAMAAPSACNLQPWAFIVVDEPMQLERVKEATVLGKYNAPLIIVVCGVTKHIPWKGQGWRQDCGAAIQNILLEANELGLASVCIGGFVEKKLRHVLSIPKDVKPMCLVEIGYPACEKEPLTWYTDEAVHWQRFDATKPRTMRTLKMLRDDAESGKI